MSNTTEWFLDGDSRDEWPESDDVMRTKTILDSISDALYVVDRRGQFLDWNERFCEVTGYTDEEVSELHEFDIIPDSYEAEARRLLASVAEGEEATLRAPLVTKGGEEVYHEFTASPLTDEAGDVWGMVGTARDISELLQTQDELRERERRFSTLVSNLPGIVYRSRNEPSWPMEFVSDGCAELTGYDSRQLEAGEISWGEDVLHPDDRERVLDAVQTAVDDGEPFTVRYRITTADGTERWCWEQGRCVEAPDGGPVVLEGFVTDITERKRRQRNLERYEELVDAVGDGVVVIDDDRRLVRCNDAFASMLGYERSELEGTPVSALVAGDLDEMSREVRESLHERESTVVSIEADVVRQDGEPIPVEGRYSLLSPDDDGKTIGLVRDLRTRKERATLFESLHEGMRDLMDAETVTEVAVRAADVIGDHFDSVSTAVRLLRNDTLELVAMETDEERLADRLPGYEVGEGFVGEAYERGEPIRYDDLDEIETPVEYDPVRSAMLLPIDGYGMINVAATEPDAFDETDLELGRLFVADLEAAFEQADREEQLRTRKRDLEKYETLVETMSDGVYITDETHTITMVNDALQELTGYAREELLGMEISDPWDEAVAERGRRERERLLAGEVSVGKFAGDLRTADGEPVPVETRFAALPSDGDFQGTVGVIRDITEQRAREDRLKRQRDELERLNRINKLVQETIGALASAATREEIERTVRERLAKSSLYRFVLTGKHHPGTESFECEAAPDEGAAYVDAVRISANAGDDDAGPAATALETGEITVADDVLTDPLFEPYRDAARDHGFRSVAAVPFTYGGVTHGILAVYADRPGAFSQREIQAFDVLGDMVGFAISATQNRRFIESDRHLEVTFSLTGTDTLAADLSTKAGCTCRLLGTAEASDDGLLHYVSVTNSDPEEFEAAARDSAFSTGEIRTVRADEEEMVMEVRHDESIPLVLLNSGVKPLDIVAEDGEVRIVAEAPQDTDLRTVTDRLETYGDVTLVSKREIHGWDDSSGTIRDELRNDLTDRQQAVLDAAYFGGYFDWPRESTAEEIAASLDISSATLHQHLRHAERKLIGAYVADEPSRS
ncbi:PAS domain S-box protein [Halorientalis brevis]|uniref:PAS domain S-box protein n=1 Tax=Halorientalis brevis TaxID=1126241 RepID=A0ABD6C9V0_9EURY|nr:PAS domain S-box protein [Halorientalis brevis]